MELRCERGEEERGVVDILASFGMVFLSPPNQVELDARTQELASQRIAFEEERLDKKGEGQVVDSEAEELRLKLKEQVKWQGRGKEKGRTEEGRMEKREGGEGIRIEKRRENRKKRVEKEGEGSCSSLLTVVH